MTRIGIIGSRAHSALYQAWELVRSLPADSVVVSGGAAGIDAIAEWSACQVGYAVDIFRPSYLPRDGSAEVERRNKVAPLARNGPLVESCAVVHAFPWGAAKGTRDAISKAQAAKVELIEHPPEDSALLIFSTHISNTAAPGYLNVTRGGGGEAAFAPSWEILSPFIAARQRAAAAPKMDEARIEHPAWNTYEPSFIDEMRVSWSAYRATWDRALATSVLSVACMCSDRHRQMGHCHTRILANLFVKAGQVIGRRVIDGGDLPVRKATRPRQGELIATGPSGEPIEPSGPLSRIERAAAICLPSALDVVLAERDLARAERDLYLFYMRREDGKADGAEAAQERVATARKRLEKLQPAEDKLP